MTETNLGLPVPPVVKTRVVPLPPDAAFDLFTRRMGEWWPLATHSIQQERATGVRFDPRVGGNVSELAEGQEYHWGEVLAWNPPHRFVMSWHPDVAPVASSVLEVRFAAHPAGTEVVLEHRGWEEFGRAALDLRNRYHGGWDMVLARYEECASQA